MPSARPNQNNEDSDPPSHHLHRPNADMEFRDSFSRLKKKVKHRLTGNKPKPNKTGADVGGQRVDSTGSRPGSEHRFVAGGGHDQEGSGANADESQVISTILLPQLDEPSSVPTRGSANDEERRETDINRRGVEQTHSHLHSVDVEVAGGSGPAEGKDVDGEKVERVYPSPPIVSVLHGDKPDSRWTCPYQIPSLTTPQITWAPLPFLTMYRQLFITRAVSQALPRTRQNQTGSLLRLLRPNCSSVG